VYNPPIRKAGKPDIRTSMKYALRNPLHYIVWYIKIRVGVLDVFLHLFVKNAYGNNMKEKDKNL